MLRRRRDYGEPENLERWLVSYADFITLLFAFFVVLYAISSVNEGKYRILSESLVNAFDVTPRSPQPVQIGEINRIKRQSFVDAPSHEPPVESPQEMGQEREQSMTLKEMADEIERAMQQLIQKDLVSVRRSDNWLEVEINTNVLFPSGSARIVSSAAPTMQALAKILAPFPNPINVEGFTDDIPINTDVFPSNWELSAARAASVVHLFSGYGVDPQRMSAIGYAQYRPIVANSSESARAKNRRVVLAILAEDFYLRSQRDKVEAENLQNGKAAIPID